MSQSQLQAKWWLKHYPPGVAHEIDPLHYHSLPQMAEECFDKFRERAALTCMDKTLSFGELDDMSMALGAWFQSRGLQKGARIALMMPNVLQYPIAILAVLRAGYMVVNVNPLYTPRELEHQLIDSGSEAIVILENFAATLEAVIPRTPVKHVVMASVGDLLGFPKGAIVNFVVRRIRKAVPKFFLHGMVKTMAKYKFNVIPAVNTMFNALVNHAGFHALDFSSLRVSNGGGMAVQRAVAEKWLTLTHTPIVEGYGLTESSAGATCNEVLNEAFSNDVGMPMPSTEVSIRDDFGVEVPLGVPGEICLRGPQMMRGYWQRPDETAKVMTADGYFKSGDIGIMLANGHVKIVDRKKDMILVSGFNVYPNEIEDVVVGCPGVMECAAIGVPDAKSGEAVKLFVGKKSGAELTEAQLMAYCHLNLTGYKCPKVIVFLDSLPKSNVGKILRRELRDK